MNIISQQELKNISAGQIFLSTTSKVVEGAAYGSLVGLSWNLVVQYQNPVASIARCAFVGAVLNLLT